MGVGEKLDSVTGRVRWGWVVVVSTAPRRWFGCCSCCCLLCIALLFGCWCFLFYFILFCCRSCFAVWCASAAFQQTYRCKTKHKKNIKTSPTTYHICFHKDNTTANEPHAATQPASLTTKRRKNTNGGVEHVRASEHRERERQRQREHQRQIFRSDYPSDRLHHSPVSQPTRQPELHSRSRSLSLRCGKTLCLFAPPLPSRPASRVCYIPLVLAQTRNEARACGPACRRGNGLGGGVGCF